MKTLKVILASLALLFTAHAVAAEDMTKEAAKEIHKRHFQPIRDRIDARDADALKRYLNDLSEEEREIALNHSVNIVSSSPLRHAAFLNYYNEVKILLEMGASPTTNDAALHLVCLGGKYLESGITQLIISYTEEDKIDIKANTGWPAIHLAAAHDETGEIIVALLNKGANRNLVDTYGDTPMDTIRLRSPEIRDRLLAAIREFDEAPLVKGAL